MKVRRYKDADQCLYESVKEFRGAYPGVKIGKWRTGQAGDWVRTDEKGVVQILRRNSSESNSWVKTICGTFLVTTKDKMRDTFPVNMHSFVNRQYTLNEAYKRRKGTTKNEKMFLEYYLSDSDPDTKERRINAYIRAFKTKSRHTARTFSRKLLVTGRMQKLMTDKLHEEAEEQGMTNVWILGQIKEAIEAAVAQHKTSPIKLLVELLGKGGFDKRTQLPAFNPNTAIPAGTIDESDAEFEEVQPKELPPVRKESDGGPVDAGTDVYGQDVGGDLDMSALHDGI